MAKVNGPILSIGASGSFGKTMVFGNWRGVPYARRHVVPANPQSTGQTLTRNAFAFLSNVWKVAGALWQAPWQQFAKGQPLTGRNAYIGQNTRVLRPMSDLTDLIISPGANGGIPPTAMTSTGGSGDIVFSLTNPTPPTGWTLSGANVLAIKQQDPQSGTDYNTYEHGLTTPFTGGTITAMPAGTYVTGAVLEWTKPDLSIAYSRSIQSTGTVT